MSPTVFNELPDDRDPNRRRELDRFPRGQADAKGRQCTRPCMESPTCRLESHRLLYSAFTCVVLRKPLGSSQSQFRRLLQSAFLAISPKCLEPTEVTGERARLEPTTTPKLSDVAEVLIKHCLWCWDRFAHTESNTRRSQKCRKNYAADGVAHSPAGGFVHESAQHISGTAYLRIHCH